MKDIIKIRLTNGISYTKSQIEMMFNSQIKLVEENILPEDKKIFISWIKNAREQ